MTLQRLMSHVRRAAHDFDMIRPGERIAVAVSGGKDSLALVSALSAMQKYHPANYSTVAITVDLGFSGFDSDYITTFCESLGVECSVVATEIGRVVFGDRAERNPCSLCSKLRKGALNREALSRGCTAVAYGHNRDDFVETFFMSLMYEGRLHVPNPTTFLDKTGLNCIRPLVYVPERDIVGFVRRQRIAPVKNPCPADGNTKRKEIKELISELKQRRRDFDAVAFGAVKDLFKRV